MNEIRTDGKTREVARRFSIPRSTLQERLKSNNVSNASMGRPSVFTKDEDEILAKQVIKHCRNIFYGISPTESRKCFFKEPRMEPELKKNVSSGAFVVQKMDG